MTEAAPKFVMHDGQLCRVVESFQPVDVAQMDLKAQEAENTLNRLVEEREALKAQLEAKEVEVEDAECVLDDCKRNADVARTVVERGADAEAEEGTGGEVANLDPQSSF